MEHLLARLVAAACFAANRDFELRKKMKGTIYAG
jgi:hypothetical protein